MPTSIPKASPTPLFLHGLDSSIQGTKAVWFRQHFPTVEMQNYRGDLEQRLTFFLFPFKPSPSLHYTDGNLFLLI